MGTTSMRTGWLGTLALVVAAGAACSGESFDAPNGAAGSASDAGAGIGNPSGGAPGGESGAPSTGDSAGMGAVTQTGGQPSGGGGAGAGGDDPGGGECEPGETRACYDGADGTQGVAACKGGMSTCSARGVWGACQGQVVPVTEVCEDGLDNDCNGEADDITDVDGDGWTVCEGDCCELVGGDCVAPARVNPAAVDVRHVAANGAVTFTDDDCSGEAGDSLAACDDGLALDDIKGESAAAAVDVCQSVAEGARGWGLISARYTSANGMTLGPGKQAGLQTAFGARVVPQHGERMLLLSTGSARASSQANACGTNSCKNKGVGTAPQGFPQQASGCQPVQTIHDDIAFELKLRAPSNATGYRFSYSFWAFAEDGTCDPYMDEFIALVAPAPAGSVNGNIAFDATGTPIASKSAFFDVCSGCTMGTAPLQGTGFDTWSTGDGPGGATSWLTSSAPVNGGEEFTVRFAIWDAGDQVMDSSVLIDHFEWLTESGVTVGTEPIANPKSQ